MNYRDIGRPELLADGDERSVQHFALSSRLSVKNVLFATDFSDTSRIASSHALQLCVLLGARLTILHVFEYGITPSWILGDPSIETDRFYEKAKFALDELEQAARRAKVICTASIVSGIPSSIILETITSRDIHLVILGTRSAHGFERLVLVSTAEAVLRKASCPVFTVGPLVRNTAKLMQAESPVIFATDFQVTTVRAFGYAALFCKLMKVPLHCLHVLPLTFEGTSQRHLIPQIMTDALHQLAAENGKTVDPPVCAVAYGSEISATVIGYAKQHNAKLIVLGVRKAPMLASHIPAHVAYRIIAEAPCPVLTMAFSGNASTTLAAACLTGSVAGLDLAFQP